ncbi:hypothetical protein SHALO_1011 [Sulfurospirillum halorespirans DSM 13726]|uniref:Uncharacterized protein n=1 Tax=Sulfurospirillum halorespirans DSM 13726 TaxID=1193502 RepID=A0A1D7TIH5_9BACT|nr:hypothetical protein SHALO_1011 [Sulfurospirillum halorespirans DSM 13726]
MSRKNVNKIEINVDTITYEFLVNQAKQLDLSLSLLCQHILTSHALAFTHKLSDETRFIKQQIKEPNEENRELKEIMVAYQITQLDMASYLKISQTAVSLYLSAKKENALIKKHLDQLGIDKFLMKIFKHKHLSFTENEVRVDFNPSFSNYMYKESSSYEIVKNWSESKKILFSYIISLDYIDEEGESIAKEKIFEAIDNTPKTCENELTKAEKEGLDTYISILRYCFETNPLSPPTLGASPF